MADGEMSRCRALWWWNIYLFLGPSDMTKPRNRVKWAVMQRIKDIGKSEDLRRAMSAICIATDLYLLAAFALVLLFFAQSHDQGLFCGFVAVLSVTLLLFLFLAGLQKCVECKVYDELKEYGPFVPGRLPVKANESKACFITLDDKKGYRKYLDRLRLVLKLFVAGYVALLFFVLGLDNIVLKGILPPVVAYMLYKTGSILPCPFGAGVLDFINVPEAKPDDARTLSKKESGCTNKGVDG